MKLRRRLDKRSPLRAKPRKQRRIQRKAAFAAPPLSPMVLLLTEGEKIFFTPVKPSLDILKQEKKNTEKLNFLLFVWQTLPRLDHHGGGMSERQPGAR